MSIINTYNNLLGWFGWGNPSPYPKTVEPAEVAQADAKPAEGETTGRQQSAASEVAGRCGVWSIHGFGEPWLGIAPFAAYREMLNNPTLALVRAVVFNQILAGTWSIESDEGTPVERVDFIKKNILRHRTTVLRHALTALDFRFAAFELVWEAKEGRLVIDRFKPLTRSLCTLLAEPNGNFAGIEQNTVKLLGPKAWLYANDVTPEEPYGRSRLRHCSAEVWRWNKTQDRIDALTNKETGSAVHVTHPPGDENKAKADTHAQNMAAGRAWLATENALGALTAIQRQNATPEVLAELLKLPLWKTENIELGGNATAISALDARLKSLESQIARGYLQLERGVFEGQHGTKAEAGVHSDTGTSDPEGVQEAIVEALNCGPVNDLLRFNFGDDAVDTVRIVADPLKDVQEEIDREVLLALFSGPNAGEMYREYDVPAMADRRGIPKRQTPLPPPAPVTPPAAPPTKSADLQMSRGDAMGELVAQLSREAEEAEGLELDRGGDGNWVTIDGEHVFIKGGVIEKGPANLIGDRVGKRNFHGETESGRGQHTGLSTKTTDARAVAKHVKVGDEAEIDGKRYHVEKVTSRQKSEPVFGEPTSPPVDHPDRHVVETRVIAKELDSRGGIAGTGHSVTHLFRTAV